MLWRVLLVSLGMAHPLTVGPAEAHPERAALGLSLRTEISPDSVQLTLTVEIPVARLALESQEPGFPDAKLRELQDSIWIRLDGERLPNEVLPVEQPVRPAGSEAGTAEISVRLRAALPRNSGVLTIENGAYPTDSAIYLVGVTVSNELVVVGTSLAQWNGNTLKNNRNGAWIRDEDARRTTVQIRPASFWERSGGSAPITERLEGRLPMALPAPLIAIVVILVFGMALFWKKR